MLCGHQEHRTPAASQVQNALIVPKAQLIQQFGPEHELASQRAVEVESLAGQNETESHPEHSLVGDDCQDEV